MKIFVAGHNGMLGSAICIKLKAKGFKNILLATRQQLDLANQKKVFEFFKKLFSSLFCESDCINLH